MSNRAHRFDSRYPHLKGCIFIVTYGRSGSTLLQTILQSIPGAHLCGENDNVILQIWNAVRKVKGAKSAWGDKGGDHPSNPWYGTKYFRPMHFADRMVDAFVDDVLRPPPTARWIGFKEIRYDEFGDDLPSVLNFMSQSFKNAKFVFNTRDADAVSRSGWWRQHDPNEVKRMVFEQDARFASYASQHRTNTFSASYEEVSTDPYSLEQLFHMLGEDFNAKIIGDILTVRLSH